MGSFEKIYQIILSLIPENSIPQTDYQKKRVCNMHVMKIRLMKILATKRCEKLFMMFTDFEAGFDFETRRPPFQKLIQLGENSYLQRNLFTYVF